MELLVFRPVFSENSSATLGDMLGCSLELTMKINEYLDIKDTIQEHQQQEAEQQQAKSLKGRG
jgi:hypothetical protein